MKVEWDFHELIEFGDNLCDMNQFNSAIEIAANEIATILKRMLKNNTPVDYGTLQAKWDEDNRGVVTKRTSRGVEIILINTTKYAVWVNDGHLQRPGRFIPGYWEGRHFRYDPSVRGEGLVLTKPFVEGRLFVEKSILQLESGRQIDRIIYKQLQKWWKGV